MVPFYWALAAEIVGIDVGQAIDISSRLTVSAILVIGIVGFFLGRIRSGSLEDQRAKEREIAWEKRLQEVRDEADRREALIIAESARRESMLIVERDQWMEVGKESQKREAEQDAIRERMVEAFETAYRILSQRNASLPPGT